MRNIILYSVITIALIALTVLTYYHVSINFLLLVSICLSILYIALLGLLKNWLKISDDKSVKNISKAYAALSYTIIYAISIFVILNYIHPNSNKPYYSNADYHAIANTGVSFNDSIVLFSNSKNEQQPGLWYDESGNVSATAQNNHVYFNISSYFAPIFYKHHRENREDIYAPLNNVFPAPITNNFTIVTRKDSLQCYLIEDVKNTVRYYFSITVDKKSPLAIFDRTQNRTFKDSFYIEHNALQKGINLYDLLINSDFNYIDSSSLTYVIPLLDQFLGDLGSTLLLVNYDDKNQRYLTLFPSSRFISTSSKFIISGKEVQPDISKTYELAYDKPFFIGFYYSINRMKFTRIADSNNDGYKYTLKIDHPDYYPLSAKNDSSYGMNQLLFIHNHYSQIRDKEIKDGFLFHDNLRNAKCNFIDGTLAYNINRPYTPLNQNISDHNGNTNTKAQLFGLVSNDNKYRWEFEIKNFSDTHFTFDSIFIYLTLLFLLLIVITYSIDGNKVYNNLEPVIFNFLYVYITFRYVLLWRLALFPPLDRRLTDRDAFINYDLDKIPFTGIDVSRTFYYVFFVLVVWYIFKKISAKGRFIKRIMPNKRFKADEKKSTAELIIENKIINQDRIPISGIPLIGKLLSSISAKLSSENHDSIRINIQNVILIGITIACIVISSSNIQLLKRVCGIIIPVIIYFYWDYSISLVNEIGKKKQKYKTFPEAFIKCINNDQKFLLNLSFLGIFVLSDTGFGILFFVFLVAKNAVLSFLKVQREDFKKYKWYFLSNLLFSLIYSSVLCVFLFNKKIFSWSFYHMIYVAVVVLAIPLIIILLSNKIRRNVKIISVTSLTIISAIVVLNKDFLQEKIENKYRYVINRSLIIHKSAEEIIKEQKIKSFESRNIINIAESQWFINYFLKNKADGSKKIDLKKHFDRGVNYYTQTRDVVLPRFVISEFGNMTMFFLLLALGIPFLLFLLTFKHSKEKYSVLYASNSTGISTLLLLFIIGFFIWMTSTNRFVFLGQDYPFLSLTSKTTLLLPLSLIIISILFTPKSINKSHNNQPPDKLLLKLGSAFLGLAIFISSIWLGVSSTNNINSEKFNIRLANTASVIDYNVNDILDRVQSIKLKNIKKPAGISNKNAPVIGRGRYFDNYTSNVLKMLNEDTAYQNLYTSCDAFTKSVLDVLINNKHMTYRQGSPVYIRHEQSKLKVAFNRQLYLELPPYDEKIKWQGDVLAYNSDKVNHPFEIVLNGKKEEVKHKSTPIRDVDNIKLLTVPANWTAKQTPYLLVNIINTGLDKCKNLLVYNGRSGTVDTLDAAKPTAAISTYDRGKIIKEDGTVIDISLLHKGDNTLSKAYWINGTYRYVYPMGDIFFWPYHFTNSISNSFSNTKHIYDDVQTTLDYDLVQKVNADLYKYVADHQGKNERFQASIIAASGKGNIRLLADYTNDRLRLDPNNEQEIAKIKSRHFFFSSLENQRDQWGNLNLLHMKYGPGSSIKPAILAALMSEVNAGWDKLVLLPPEVEGTEYSSATDMILKRYAGVDIKDEKGFLAIEGEAYNSFNVQRYIYKSSNIYHSLLMFLGSYQKKHFYSNNMYSLESVLIPAKDIADKDYPLLSFNTAKYYLPDPETGWPGDNPKKLKGRYLGDKQSILSSGFESYYDVNTNDKNKSDFYDKTVEKEVAFTSSELYNIMNKDATEAFLWSFPEQSFFLQSERAMYDNMHDNFLFGLKIPTLGGSPYNITPYKMAELYGRLFSLNENYTLHISPDSIKDASWHFGAGWNNMDSAKDYIRRYVYKSMEDVLTNNQGTMHKLFGNSNRYKNYFFYAKTGTISREKSNFKNSKRLVLIISKNDLLTYMEQPKIYTVYLMINDVGDHPYDFYKQVLDRIIDSDSFKEYMQNEQAEE